MKEKMLLPLLIEPTELIPLLNHPDILIIDLGHADRYQQGHIPNAVYVAPSALMCGIPPAMGKLPNITQLESLFSQIGLAPEKHVVVYDDEGGGWAGRFIWTLDVIGHKSYSYLNGGMVAWMNEGNALSNVPASAQRVDYKIQRIHSDPIAELDYILDNLKNPDMVVWDARSLEEYNGTKMLAQKAGHIPGAVHFEWTQAMDRQRNLRVKDLHSLKSTLSSLGITSEKEIITHCQSHHRSGFTYLIAKLLGFKKIKGYHGSWSEWGNHPTTPVEI